MSVKCILNICVYIYIYVCVCVCVCFKISSLKHSSRIHRDMMCLILNKRIYVEFSTEISYPKYYSVITVIPISNNIYLSDFYLRKLVI